MQNKERVSQSHCICSCTCTRSRLDTIARVFSVLPFAIAIIHEEGQSFLMILLIDQSSYV